MQKYECKTCGAELKWNATAGALQCDYCGSTFSPEEFDDATTTDAVNDTSSVMDTTYTSHEVEDGQLIYKCNECGAEVVALETTMATECPYCGRPISITSAHKGEFRPEKVLPYKVEKEQAIENLKKYLSKAILAPEKFRASTFIDQIKGLYIPFYLHNFSLKSYGSYECEQISSKLSGDDKVETHQVFNVQLRGMTDFERIPVDGSTAIDDSIMYALEPFEFENLKDYNPAYMAGYYADQPDETVDSTKERAFSRGKSAVEEKFLERLKKYDSVKRASISHSSSAHSAEYAMLPIWRLNVSFKNRIYQYTINGQTGEVSGKIPISIPKVATVSGVVGILTTLVNLFKFF